MGKSNSDSDYYLKYGLFGDPFPEGVIDKYIFLTPGINRRLKLAKEYVNTGRKLLLITSLPGAGKSLIARKLIVLQDANWSSCLVSANADMQPESLALSVIQQLLPGEDINTSRSISMLHKYLEQSYRESKLPVIVVDDAHTLSLNTLQFVLQLADLRYNKSLFRIVLFANESINEIFARDSLKELAKDTIDVFSLPCFSPDQIHAYLDFRFSSCGKIAELPFTAKDMEFLHRASAGLPGGINLLARQLMQKNLKKTSSQSTRGVVTVFLLLLLLILSYFYYERSTTEGEKTLPSAAIRTEQLTIPHESLSLRLSDMPGNNMTAVESQKYKPESNDDRIEDGSSAP